MGANTANDRALDWNFRNMIPEIAEQLLDALPSIGGVAIVEYQHDEPTIVEGISHDNFRLRERELLETASDIMPTIPFDDLDVLVVNQPGKDVSGQGMDTTVIGRRPFAINEPEHDRPTIKGIFTRSLTEATHSKEIGIKYADVVHRSLLEDLEAETTLINAVIGSTPRGV